MSLAKFSLGTTVVLISALLFSNGLRETTLAAEHPEANLNSHSPSLTFMEETWERTRKARPPIRETADAILIRKSEWKWNRYLKEALNLPHWVDLGLEHRTRFETYDHPWRTIQPKGQTDAQIQQRSRIRVGLDGAFVRFLFEGQDSRVHLSELSDFDFVNATIRNEFDIVQVFLSVTRKDLFGTNLRSDLHFGRLTMDFGSRRLINRNGYRNTTNAFDGFHWQVAQEKTWRVRAFLVQPVIRDETKLDTQTKRYVFWGLYGESQHLPWLHINTYYFGLNDQRFPIANLDRTYSTLGIRLYALPHPSRMDYEIESVWQIGKLENTDHFAHFQTINVGYTFNLPWSPRVLFQYDYASGDRNPNDSQSSGFDTLFGGRRFGYMPTGNFGPFFRRNISSPGWRILVKPAKRVRFQLKQRFWYLATSRGGFSGSGLQDSTGNSGNYLGHDLEIQVRWKVNKNLWLDAGYDHWFKGSYFERLPASAGLPPGGEKDTDYFYIMTKLRI